LNLPPGDILIHAFDLLPDENQVEALVDLNDWLGTLPYKHRVVIAGNHDLLFVSKPVQARKLLTNANGPVTSHLGCTEITRAVLRVKHRLHVFGHVHGGYGREVGPHGISFVNCAILERIGEDQLGRKRSEFPSWSGESVRQVSAKNKRTPVA
jgi:predicted phosphohydrolase